MIHDPLLQHLLALIQTVVRASIVVLILCQNINGETGHEGTLKNMFCKPILLYHLPFITEYSVIVKG